MPDTPIDLFTDADIEDTVFSQIHRLEHSFFRPKMEAMRRSRFERTVIIDADILVTADISELFDVLDTYDMAGVQAVRRTQNVMNVKNRPVPRCFPLVNTGLLVIRKNKPVLDFCWKWEREVRANQAKLDQGYFRTTLYNSGLRFLSLPVEYNLIYLKMLDAWPTAHGAPRVLHSRALHQSEHPGDICDAYSLSEAVGSTRAAVVKALLEDDWSLQGKRSILTCPDARFAPDRIR